jgi:hypothetical protein
MWYNDAEQVMRGTLLDPKTISIAFARRLQSINGQISFSMTLIG